MSKDLISAFLEGDCLKIETSLEFSIADGEANTGRCYIVNAEETEGQFKVSNPRGKEIYFLAIDKCLLDDQDNLERCDFAIFDESTFCFVEIKETRRRRGKVREKAIQQLEATINYFKQHIDFEDYRLEAIIYLVSRGAYPAADTNKEKMKARFATKLETLLLEGNHKAFP